MSNKRKKRNQAKSRKKRLAKQAKQVGSDTVVHLPDYLQVIPNEPPIVDIEQLMWFYRKNHHEAALHLIVNTLLEYEKFIFAKLSQEHQQRVDIFINTTMYILTSPKFVIPASIFPLLMSAAPLLNNVITMSSFRNTDGALRMVLNQPENLFKVLPLCTARNEVQVAPDVLIKANPTAGSLWWLQYISGLAGLTNELSYNNARRWLADVPEDLIIPDWRCTPLYFRATYISPDNDRIIKQRMNEQVQAHLPQCKPVVCNTPKPKRVAVVSARWYSRSAVYKTSEPHIRSLKARGYDLDLIHLGSKHVDDLLDREPFTKVKYVDIGKEGFNYKEVADNDYAAIYYPDIGMNNESIWLSNMRLAPVQVMGLGHPVSTFGSKVDYIITGEAVEHPDLVQNNYSERVVLIPGLGATPVDPQYTQKYAEKAEPEFIINCCWTAPKLNYPMLKALVDIKKQASKQVIYHFLPSWTMGRQNAAITFLRDMHALFGKDVLVTAEKPYHDYLECMESGSLSLVPHPFGGCNTVVDSFAVGLPCVALEGDKWYNRCAPGLLRQCGFDDLITHSVKEYIAKTVEIIDNDSYRLELIGRLSLVNLQKTLYSTEEPEYFADAFDYILENHKQLQAQDHRNPIRIGC